MIYVSTSCVKHSKIKESVQELVNEGFKNIELSGGTEYYKGFENDLLNLKEEYNLNYRCHNYFPPPKKHFVLNLASLDDNVFKTSMEHVKRAIELSKKLNANKYAFHAGFFIDIKLNEIGKKISKESLFDKNESILRFCDAVKELHKDSKEITLYIENNVFSSTNAKTYNNKNFFMLSHYKEFQDLSHQINFNLLLDVAHLKVSAKSLGLDFSQELSNMLKVSDYIHISDNDGLHDLNQSLKKESYLATLLRKENFKNKDSTIEVYDGMSAVKSTYQVLESIIND